MPRKNDDMNYGKALKAMGNADEEFRLRDIPKRLWSEELLCAAIAHNHTDLKEIPEAMRTTKVCMTAIDRFDGVSAIAHIPQKRFTYDVALYLAISRPACIDTIMYRFRQGREETPHTEEDISLLAAASLPTERWKHSYSQNIPFTANQCARQFGCVSEGTSMHLISFAIRFLKAHWNDPGVQEMYQAEFAPSDISKTDSIRLPKYVISITAEQLADDLIDTLDDGDNSGEYGDRKSPYLEVAHAPGQDSNPHDRDKVFVSLIERSHRLGSDDPYYELHIIDDVTGADCDLKFTNEQTKPALIALLQETIDALTSEI